MPRHHIVPQMLLRRFATASGQLRAVPRQGGTPLSVSVKRAAAESGFYEVELASEVVEEYPREWMEQSLSYFENRAAPIIQRLVEDEFSLSAWDRFYLTLFVALQKCRGWAFRSDLSKLMTMSARLELESSVTPDRVRSYLAKRGEPVDDSSVEEFVDAAINGPWKISGSTTAYVQAMLMHVFEDAHPHLFLERRIRLLRFRDPVLLTSDEPVALWGSPARDHDAYPLGFVTADAIWLPLDPQHALSFIRWGDEGIFDSPSTRAQQLNRAVAAGAHRWIFQHPEQPPMEAALLPPPGRFEREIVRVSRHQNEVRVLNRVVKRTPPRDIVGT